MTPVAVVVKVGTQNGEECKPLEPGRGSVARACAVMVVQYACESHLCEMREAAFSFPRRQENQTLTMYRLGVDWRATGCAAPRHCS